VGTYKRAAVQALLIASTVLSFSYFIAACLAANQCYVDPCETDPGLDVMFRVSNGDSFQIIIFGIVFILHGIWCFWTITSRSVTIRVGAMLGWTFLSSVSALGIAVCWGSQVLMVNDLSNNTLYAVNEGTKSRFSAVCALASLLFVFQGSIFVALYVFKDELQEPDNWSSFDGGPKDDSAEGLSGSYQQTAQEAAT